MINPTYVYNAVKDKVADGASWAADNPKKSAVVFIAADGATNGFGMTTDTLDAFFANDGLQSGSAVEGVVEFGEAGEEVNDVLVNPLDMSVGAVDYLVSVGGNFDWEDGNVFALVPDAANGVTEFLGDGEVYFVNAVSGDGLTAEPEIYEEQPLQSYVNAVTSTFNGAFEAVSGFLDGGSGGENPANGTEGSNVSGENGATDLNGTEPDPQNGYQNGNEVGNGATDDPAVSDPVGNYSEFASQIQNSDSAGYIEGALQADPGEVEEVRVGDDGVYFDSVVAEWSEMDQSTEEYLRSAAEESNLTELFRQYENEI
jgi:hypothetical protein